MILISIIQIHTIIYKNKKIIKNQGLIKISFFNLGFLLYLISQFFSTQINYMYSGLNITLKHMGIGLMLYIIFIYIYSGCKLGIKIVLCSRSFLSSISIKEESRIEFENKLIRNNNNSNMLIISNEKMEASNQEIVQENLNNLFKILKYIRS